MIITEIQISITKIIYWATNKGEWDLVRTHEGVDLQVTQARQPCIS